MSSSMPAQRPGRSKQDYQTPPEFLDAVLRRYSIRDFSIDLAASAMNRVTDRFYSEADNALVQPWGVGAGWAWCNPPYAHIGPWVKRAYEQSREPDRRILMLLPAGVGSNWFRDWVHGKAKIIFLNGRLQFVGTPDPYPKDLLLLQYQSGCWCNDYSVWSWAA